MSEIITGFGFLIKSINTSVFFYKNQFNGEFTQHEAAADDEPKKSRTSAVTPSSRKLWRKSEYRASF